MFDMFDFSSCGSITYDELALLLSTVTLAAILAAAAVDRPDRAQATADALTDEAYIRAGKDAGCRIELHEFLDLVQHGLKLPFSGQVELDTLVRCLKLTPAAVSVAKLSSSASSICDSPLL
jgi:hypothetical protein